MKAAVAVLALLVAACAHLPPECNLAVPPMHCPKPRPRVPCDCIEVCEIHGSERRCELVRRGEIGRILRPMVY